MSAINRPRRVAVFWPVVLVLAGCLLLLYNLDALSAGAGWRLLEVAPLILVMLGLQIVLGRGLHGPSAGAATLAAVGLVGLAGFAYVTLGPAVGGANYAQFTSSSPIAGVHAGTLRIDAAATQVSIVFGDVHDDLYRAQVRYAGDAPNLTYANGELHLSSSNRFGIGWGSRPDQLTVTLSSSVPWTIAVNGAGVSIALETTGAGLKGFALNGVGSTADLSLGTPTGTVPLEADGLGTRLTIVLPAGAQYRIDSNGLASTVQGASQTPGWAATSDRYDVSSQGLAVRVEVRTR